MREKLKKIPETLKDNEKYKNQLNAMMNLNKKLNEQLEKLNEEKELKDKRIEEK
jgi:hypothetical protein